MLNPIPKPKIALLLRKSSKTWNHFSSKSLITSNGHNSAPWSPTDLWTRFPAVLDEQNPNFEVSDTFLLRKTFKNQTQNSSKSLNFSSENDLQLIQKLLPPRGGNRGLTFFVCSYKTLYKTLIRFLKVFIKRNVSATSKFGFCSSRTDG